MKRLAVGLLMVGFLVAVAGPASAGHTAATSLGMADPLGLIASGAIVPFFSSGGDVSVLEISSPVGDNTSAGGGAALHLVFFSGTCTRAESVSLPLTENDTAVPILNNLTGQSRGLVAIGGTLNGFDLVKLKSPIHALVHRFNFTTGSDYSRVYDPIAAVNAEEQKNSIANLPAALIGDPDGTFNTWNPIRSGATFDSPVLDGSFLNASLDFVCPQTAITGAWVVAGQVPAVTWGGTTIAGVVFDGDENFLRDITTTCDCLKTVDVAGLNPVFKDATATKSGVFYTELAGTVAGGLRAAFVAYRTIRVTFTDTSGRARAVDDFHRLPNAHALSLNGVAPGAVIPAR